MTKYFIIDIIPLVRLPSKAPDFFSYFSKKKIRPGNIVLVEFKKRKIFGYVWKVESIEKRRKFLKEEKLELKPVLKIVNPSPLIFPYQIKLAFWLKNYNNISLSTALSLFFPYKKIITLSIKDFKKTESSAKKKKTLIIVPQESYLEFLSKKYPSANLILPQRKNFFFLLEKIINDNKETFIGTKNSIFLPWQNLEKIIVYDEGSIFYKEFFKPPYFDYRKIFLKFAEINKIKYEIEGGLPSFESIIRTQIDVGKSTLINTDKYINKDQRSQYPRESALKNLERINEKEFENKIKEFEKTVIFVPEKIFGRKIICEFCLQALTCEVCGKFLALEENFVYCLYCLKKENLPEICPFCQKKSQFIISQKGARAVYQLLLNLKRNVYFLEKENKKIIKKFNESQNADLVGSLLLLNPLIENFPAFFFYNFSEFYHANDFFLKEKFIRILEFFKEKCQKIFLVSNIFNPQVEEKIRTGKIINDLIEERKINNLPPFKRLVILKEGSKDLKKLQEKLSLVKEKIKKENPEIEIFGPIFARPFKIKKRFFLELVLKIDPQLDFNLRKILKDIEIEEIDADAFSY
jgi:primosomal protein N' (replication factor Y) (superfamily II helicase)